MLLFPLFLLFKNKKITPVISYTMGGAKVCSTLNQVHLPQHGYDQQSLQLSSNIFCSLAFCISKQISLYICNPMLVEMWEIPLGATYVSTSNYQNNTENSRLPIDCINNIIENPRDVRPTLHCSS